MVKGKLSRPTKKETPPLHYWFRITGVTHMQDKPSESRNSFKSCINRIMNEKQCLEHHRCTQLGLSPEEINLRINAPELEGVRVCPKN